MPSRAPQLVRARSGPATLSHAVFEMLYVELRSVLGGLRRARTTRARDRARAKAVRAKKARSEAAAAAVAAAAVVPEEKEEGHEEGARAGTLPPETEDESKVLVPLVDREGAGVVDATVGGETGASVGVESVGTADVCASGATKAEEADKGEEEEEEEGKAENNEVFERLADMQDDLACLTLSRELQVLVSEVTMLLLCVSSTDSCRSLLSQPRWIAVLLGLLRLGPPYAQRRALRLLRRLLPHCNPESLAESSGGAQAVDDADWSIVTIVKESGAGAALSADDGDADGEDSKEGSETTGLSGIEAGGGVPMVRVTSLSNSVHASLIPARSLLCFFLDAIGGSYQTTPRPELLGDAEGEGGGANGGGSGDRRAGGTLRELRSWYRGQAPSSSSGREQQRNAWSFSQVEGPLVCESVSLLRTLLQTSAWGGVTATLLQDAFQRGNSCLRLLAREAADKAEIVVAACASAATTGSTAPAQVGANAENANTSGTSISVEGQTGSTATGMGTAASDPSVASEAGEDSAGTVAESSRPSAAGAATPGPSRQVYTEDRAARAPLAGASAPPGTTGTLLRTLGALSVLGGHVDVLYPGASAEIMPLEYGVASRGGAGGGGSGGRGGRSSQSGSSGWGVRMGRNVFGLSGLERAANAAGGGGDGRNRNGGGGGGGFAPPGASSASAAPAAGGRPCVVVSLSLAEGQAEVILEGGDGDASGGAAAGVGGDARKQRVVPLDCLQAVPNVPVRPGSLPPGLAQRVLETVTLWCLDKSLNAAFSERLSPTTVPFATPPASASQQQQPVRVAEGAAGPTGLTDVLSTSVLDRHLLLGLVRCQAAKAAQILLLHRQTASEFVRSASAPAPGRKAKGGVGAVLLEVASGVSSSAGLGDIGAMEELVAMLLAHWQFSVLDGRSKRVQEARYGEG